jgi:hypothetical protein
MSSTGQVQVVDHDLIAAGHPRLNFEFNAYFESLPAHWDRRTDEQRSRILQSGRRQQERSATVQKAHYRRAAAVRPASCPARLSCHRPIEPDRSAGWTRNALMRANCKTSCWPRPGALAEASDPGSGSR